MKKVIIKVRQDETCRDISLPRYMSDSASGLDLKAAVKEEAVLGPGKRMLVPTGLFIEVPPGYEAEIRPRSGLAIKHGLSIVNAPGTIDADYRGEVGIILINLGDEPFIIRRGERIAQMIIKEVVRAELLEEDRLSETGRNSGGFGHTGIN
ncbi:MAG: dUTP diphosphatase [Candidatus Ratteibacteria bacterium]|nr:dUTP diphosphatase [Candidatus Ratteibacteria bacterium]